jgi:hypothetical protein
MVGLGPQPQRRATATLAAIGDYSLALEPKGGRNERQGRDANDRSRIHSRI